MPAAPTTVSIGEPDDDQPALQRYGLTGRFGDDDLSLAPRDQGPWVRVADVEQAVQNPLLLRPLTRYCLDRTPIAAWSEIPKGVGTRPDSNGTLFRWLDVAPLLEDVA